jgi:hypothetical protein
VNFPGLLVPHKLTLQEIETVIVNTIGEAFFQQIEIEVLAFSQGDSCATTGTIITRLIMGAVGASGNAIGGDDLPQ